MNWAGKIGGMIIGFMVGGPLGLLVGLLIGHLFDQRWLRRLLISPSPSVRQVKTQQVFFNATFRVMGSVAKSDGRVSENEIRQAQLLMRQMGLDQNLRREAIRLFTEGKQPEFNLSATIEELKQACLFQPALLRVFLEMQIQMAYADGGNISERKRRVLRNICQQMGISPLHFQQFEQRFRGEQTGYRYQSSQPDPQTQLQRAYQLLGVGPSANDAEVKKAYRRLMSQHHPDKLMSKGLPPEMIKMATQKTQQIKSAYEQICQAREAHAA